MYKRKTSHSFHRAVFDNGSGTEDVEAFVQEFVDAVKEARQTQTEEKRNPFVLCLVRMRGLEPPRVLPH